VTTPDCRGRTSRSSRVRPHLARWPHGWRWGDGAGSGCAAGRGSFRPARSADRRRPSRFRWC